MVQRTVGRNRRTLLACALFFTLALSGPAQADHGCNGTVVTVAVGVETFHIDVRSTVDNPADIWIYLESNGEPGLQSGGYFDLLPEDWEPGYWDPCRHWPPDSLVF